GLYLREYVTHLCRRVSYGTTSLFERIVIVSGCGITGQKDKSFRSCHDCALAPWHQTAAFQLLVSHELQLSLQWFAARGYGISTADRPQSALMLRAWMTLPHFSVSSAMSLPKSACGPASNMPPISASRALNLASTRPALISLLSFSTISAGVRRTRPPHRAQSLDGGYAEVANRLSSERRPGCISNIPDLGFRRAQGRKSLESICRP